MKSNPEKKTLINGQTLSEFSSNASSQNLVSAVVTRKPQSRLNNPYEPPVQQFTLYHICIAQIIQAPTQTFQNLDDEPKNQIQNPPPPPNQTQKSTPASSISKSNPRITSAPSQRLWRRMIDDLTWWRKTLQLPCKPKNCISSKPIHPLGLIGIQSLQADHILAMW